MIIAYDLCVCLQVKGVILDPSCSGSGTVVSRMDHLLPGSTSGSTVDEQEQQRVEQLAKFQVGVACRPGWCFVCMLTAATQAARQACMMRELVGRGQGRIFEGGTPSVSFASHTNRYVAPLSQPAFYSRSPDRQHV